MNDPVNGAEVPLPEAIRKAQEEIPEFKAAWEVKLFQNPENTVMQILMHIPPPGSDAKPIFSSQIPIMTNRGPGQMGFKILDATTIEEAVAGWQAAARLALVEMHKQIKEQSKRIIIPDANDRASLPPVPKLALN